MNDLAVLLMAYWAPDSEQDIEPYLTDILGGRKPNPELLEDLKERYRKIGGKSPLLQITMALAHALEERLRSDRVNVRVYVGMKHWHPYIREIVPRILIDGFHRIIALVMAPHYSEISIGGYKQALDRSLEGNRQVNVDFIESWYDNPVFHQAAAEKVTKALKQFHPSKVEIMFTAHSLPERIIRENDPYPKQLEASCQSIANLLKLNHWSFAYQSASGSGEKWLGPSILEVLQQLSDREGHPDNVLVVPIGFVADHLETLFDLDVEAQDFAKSHGLNLKRTESLNTSPTFISALADLIRKRVDES
jgi:ferrochelatase